MATDIEAFWRSCRKCQTNKTDKQKLLIPKSELTPRFSSMPRSQPMSSYPLYSSLVFCHSQAPISVTAK